MKKTLVFIVILLSLNALASSSCIIKVTKFPSTIKLLTNCSDAAVKLDYSVCDIYNQNIDVCSVSLMNQLKDLSYKLVEVENTIYNRHSTDMYKYFFTK